MKKIILLFTTSMITLSGVAQEKDYSKKDSANAKSSVLVNVGADFADKDDWESAIFWYNLALEFNDANITAYYDRAIAKYNLGDYRGSILDYNVTISFQPNNSDAYYGRALSYGKLGNKEKCCLDLSKSGEKGNKEAYAMINYLCN